MSRTKVRAERGLLVGIAVLHLLGLKMHKIMLLPMPAKARKKIGQVVTDTLNSGGLNP